MPKEKFVPLDKRVVLEGCTTHQRGDEEFHFISTSGVKEKLTLAHRTDPMGDRILISWVQKTEANPFGLGKYEYFKTYSEALYRLADILGGNVSFLEFGPR